MPNWRRPPGLLVFRRLAPRIVALLAPAILSGCSGNPGLRSGGVSRTRTYLGVGDRPLRVVTGEPGSAVASDVAPSPLARSSSRGEGRISGRVYDEEGRPVPGATVRLAVGPAQAGRINRATTDASGAFTLRDLRPGSSHTLIAEWEGDDGLLTGRTRASSNDSGVKISLVQDSTLDRPSLAERPNRINRVSDSGRNDFQARTSAEPIRMTDEATLPDEGEARPARPPAVSLWNEEDLPPAPEAETLIAPALVDRDPVTRQASRPRLSSWQPVGSVRRASVEPSPVPSSESDLPRTDFDRPSDRENPPRPSHDSYEEEGPSPLPPAVERWPAPEGKSTEPRSPDFRERQTSSAISPDPFEEDSPEVRRPDHGGGMIDPGPSAGGNSVNAPRLATTPRGDRRGLVEPTSESPPTPEPGALVAVPQSFAPIVLSDEPYEAPAPRQSAEARRSSPPPAPPRPGTRTRAPISPLDPGFDPFTEPSASTPKPESPVVAEPPRSATLNPIEEALPDWANPDRDAERSARVAEVDPPAATPSLDPRTEPIVTPLGNDPPVRAPVVARPSNPALSLATEPRSATAGAAKRRPTWGEVASRAGQAVPLERRGGPIAAVDPETKPTLLVREDPVGRSKPPSVTKPTCEYDDRLRRVLDFRLPNLEGGTTRFKDLDADLILLDFWGTWCPPCLKSMPHLVELQKKIGDKKLRVVGVACEQDAPGQSTPRVAKVARGLKVNYPVLLSRNDGSCPLQKALHIQAFPTMILLDREGRVLWRDQGATPATLSRLDRMIEVTREPSPASAKRGN